MNRDKQISEMVKHCPFYEDGNCILCEELWVECDTKCDMCEFAKRLYTAGYRESTDLASAIFEEIEKEIELALDSNYRAKKEHYNHSVIPNYDNFKAMCDGKIYAMRGLLDFMKELKEKYTEGEKDDGN